MDSAGQQTGTEQGQPLDQAFGAGSEASRHEAPGHVAGGFQAEAEPDAADVLGQIGALRSFLDLHITRLIRCAHAATAEIAWNPAAIPAADVMLAGVEEATRNARATLTALAQLPPVMAQPMARDELVARFEQQQSLSVDRIDALIWQLRGYADLIRFRPLNVPAMASIEQSLQDTATNVHTLTRGLGLLGADLRRELATEPPATAAQPQEAA